MALNYNQHMWGYFLAVRWTESVKAFKSSTARHKSWCAHSHCVPSELRPTQVTLLLSGWLITHNRHFSLMSREGQPKLKAHHDQKVQVPFPSSLICHFAPLKVHHSSDLHVFKISPSESLFIGTISSVESSSSGKCDTDSEVCWLPPPPP